MEVAEKETILSAVELAQKAKETIELKIEIVSDNGEKEIRKQVVAQNVAALTPSCFSALANLYFAPKFFNKDIYLYKFLVQLIGMDNDFELLDDETVKDLGMLAQPFIIEKPICYKNLSPELIIKVSKQSKRLEGFGNGLAGLVFDEYIMMELLFDRFLKERNDEDLDLIASVFYREKGVGFKAYLKSEDEYIDFAKKHLSREQKVCAIFSYMCMRNWFTNHFYTVFKNTGSSGSGKSRGWRKTIVRMAGPELGSPDDVRYTLLYDVMELIADRMESVKKK